MQPLALPSTEFVIRSIVYTLGMNPVVAAAAMAAAPDPPPVLILDG